MSLSFLCLSFQKHWSYIFRPIYCPSFLISKCDYSLLIISLSFSFHFLLLLPLPLLLLLLFLFLLLPLLFFFSFILPLPLLVVLVLLFFFFYFSLSFFLFLLLFLLSLQHQFLDIKVNTPIHFHLIFLCHSLSPFLCRTSIVHHLFRVPFAPLVTPSVPYIYIFFISRHPFLYHTRTSLSYHCATARLNSLNYAP